ncbi:MAG: hypothetical protein GQ527_08175 [Bacteroidales bacterium]|nr:hypothetical protein [Bacteroidales bacterium]
MYAIIRNVFILAIISLTVISCKPEDDCDGIDCFTPPPPLYFNLVDKDSGENLFETGVLDSLFVIVVDSDIDLVKHNFLQSNYSIELPEITFLTGPRIYYLSVGDDVRITFKLDMTINVEGCCTFFTLNIFEVLNQDYEFDEHAMTATVFIDTTP